jgi:hypothetical protein
MGGGECFVPIYSLALTSRVAFESKSQLEVPFGVKREVGADPTRLPPL